MDEDVKRQYKELAYRLGDQLAAGADDAELTAPDGTPWHVHRDADGASGSTRRALPASLVAFGGRRFHFADSSGNELAAWVGQR
jgi:predicted enzyme related to lactoylglutathione lyase